MSKVIGGGRLGNMMTRNIAASIIAQKHNLQIIYQSHETMKKIGIPLFSGIKMYETQKNVNDNNYFSVLHSDKIEFNIILSSFCQTKQITDEIHTYLNSHKNMEYIMNNNRYNNRYNNNNDCFIHIRLGDVAKWNPGFKYYDYVLSKLKYDNIYIATDNSSHIIVRKILNKYKNVNIMDNNLVKIFQYGSTCRFVILSYGTFSAMIGYISYYSYVYCLKFCKKYAWDWDLKDECDMFRDKSTKLDKWTVIDVEYDIY